MPEIIEPFHLTNDDGNITEADGSAAAWADIWKLQVPRGNEMILAAGDTFSAYVEDASAEVSDRTAKVNIPAASGGAS